MMHGTCGHSVHSHLSDESLVKDSPFDSPGTIHRKTHERCADFQILKNGEIKVELQVQALKIGTTVESTFEYYWSDNLSELIWKEAHLMADLSRGMLCSKCGKTIFSHTATHFTDRIKPYV